MDHFPSHFNRINPRFLRSTSWLLPNWKSNQNWSFKLDLWLIDSIELNRPGRYQTLPMQSAILSDDSHLIEHSNRFVWLFVGSVQLSSMCASLIMMDKPAEYQRQYPRYGYCCVWDLDGSARPSQLVTGQLQAALTLYLNLFHSFLLSFFPSLLASVFRPRLFVCDVYCALWIVSRFWIGWCCCCCCCCCCCSIRFCRP